MEKGKTKKQQYEERQKISVADFMTKQQKDDKQLINQLLGLLIIFPI